MSKHIVQCHTCRNYSLQAVCSCGSKTVLPRPPKFSLDDKYADYRRKSKITELIKKGLY